MSDPENQTLIGAASQQTAINAPAQGARSSRAYKVAGITLLACILIVGQAAIAYFLLSQRSDIKSLEEQSNDMRAELTKGRSVAVPGRMHMPINALPELMDVSVDKEPSTPTPEQFDPSKATECQLEAAGVKPMQVPGFRPTCDERGLYQAQQCFLAVCWCVNTANGQEIPDTMTNGPASCRTSAVRGGLSRVLTLPDTDM